MFFAMNRFTVPLENAEAFENIWLNRDSRLHEMQGFIEFNMLRGPEAEGARLYVSHTVWASEDDFKAWLKSGQFSGAHKRKAEDGPAKPRAPDLMRGGNTFEAFTSFQCLQPKAAPDV